MPSKIRVLSDDTINKIAAGEVIENPASVVKELSENSIDAGATEITIEIREGGRNLIRITDNGCGMNGDDALLCLERHATSKLKAVDDIEELITMGFRGEAIPSIASISKFTLITRYNESTSPDLPGTMVIVDGGKIIKCCPVECAKGTTIEVKSIFFNVPVRRKFQKSPAYDAAEISRVVTLLALANPAVKFHLISNQETVISVGAFEKISFQEQLEERVQQILGNNFVRGLCPLNLVKDEYSLQGFLGLPAAAKHNRTGQYLFINRRAVASPLVSFAIRDGYGTMLGTGKHPIYILHLTLPGNLLDVNVHPQKREVRLRQEHVLKELIIRSVNEALQKGGMNTQLSEPSTSMPVKSEFESYRNERPQFNSFSTSAFGPPGFTDELANSEKYCSSPSFASTPTHSWPPLESNATDIEKASSMESDSFSQQLLFKPQTVNGPSFMPQDREGCNLQKSQANHIKVLATLPRYIIAQPLEVERAVLFCLIDQRAAHARIMYEKLQKRSEFSLAMQALLIPYIFDLQPAEAAFFKDQISALQKFGLHIKEFGPRTFMIDALPHILGNVDIQLLIEEVIRNLRDLDINAIIEQELEKKIVLAACKAAISGEKQLDIVEAQGLVDQLMDCGMPAFCPSGKATMLSLSSAQITALFKSV